MKSHKKILSVLLIASTLISNISIPSFASENDDIKASTIQPSFSITIPKSLTLSGSDNDFSVGNYNVTVSGEINDDEVLIVKPDDNFYLKSNGKDDVLAQINQESTKWYNTQLNTTSKGSIKALLTAGSWDGTFNFDISLEKDENAFKYTTLSFSPNKLTITKNLSESIEVYFNGKDVTNFVSFENDSDIISFSGNTFTGLKEGNTSVKVSYDLNNEEGFKKDKTIYSTFDIEVIPCQHNFTLINSTDATCVLDSTEEYKCDICGEVKTEHETLATGHIAKEPIETENIEPTCTKEGKITTTTYCDICGEVINSETTIIPMLEHDFVEDSVLEAPSCTEDGVRLLKCRVCGEEKTEVISRIGHTPGEFEIVLEPTCTNKGLKVEKCEVCGAIIREEEIDALGHNLIEETVESTCEKEGKKTTTCSRCDYKEEEILPLKEHVVSDFIVVKEPDCTQSGLAERRCEVCGSLIETKILAALGHTTGETIIENKIDATCTENGSYDEVVYCTVCNEELSRVTKTINKFGHTQSNPIEENRIEATCTENGFCEMVTYCNLCGAELMREKNILPSTGHNYELTQTIENSCVKDGQKIFTCSKCGDVQKEMLPATGHVYVLTDLVVDVPPTCSSEGIQSVHCKICGETIEGTAQKLNKLPHTFTTYVSNNDATCTKDGTKTAVCDVCGDAYDIQVDKGTKLNHPYTETIVEPTCIAQGYTKYTCDVCGDSVDNVLPALGHNFVNAVCTRCGKKDLSTLEPGLYDDSHNLVKSWSALLSEGVVHVDNNGNFTTNIKHNEDGSVSSGNDSSDALTGTLILPNTVKTIKSNAVAYLDNLKAIYVPETVTTIESGSFKNNAMLESVNIDENNNYFTVEDDILFNKSKTALIYCPPSHEGEVYQIPETVTSLYSGAFSYANIDYILVPSTIESIGAQCFQNSKIKTMDLSACTKITTLGSVFGYNVKPGYTYFGVFQNCSNLTSIKLPSSIKVLGDKTFCECPNLVNVSVPTSVTKIGRSAFYGVTAEFEANMPNIELIGQNAFQNSNVTNVVTGNNFKNLENYAFHGCKKLVNADMSASTKLTSLGSTYLGTSNTGTYSGEFQNCTALTSVKLPTSIITIGDNAFNGATNLTSLEGIESVEVLGRNVLRNTGNIGEVNMPNIKTIGLYAFESSKLTAFTSGDKLTTFDSTSHFRNCTNLKTVDLSQAQFDAIGMAGGNYWGSFQEDANLISVKLPNTVKTIGDNTFKGCVKLTDVNIPTSAEIIGTLAYSGIPAEFEANLQNIKILYGQAFYNSGVTSFVAGSNLEDFVGGAHFRNCAKLTTVDLSACNKLKVLSHSTNLNNTTTTNYYYGTFHNCKALQSAKLPDGLEEINDGVFTDCSSLTSLNIPTSLKKIGRLTFQNVPANIKVNLPNIEMLGLGAFRYAGINTIEFGDSLILIEKDALREAKNLSSAKFSSGNWFVTTTAGATTGTDVDVTNSTTNATNLKTTYYASYWYKK